MSLYVIGDTHLSFGVAKPMDIFPGWEGYTETLRSAWISRIQPEDTVVLAGDISWGKRLSEALPDFLWLDRLPGREKIILKGNHDYWWTTAAKMNAFFAAEGLSTLRILHNNHFAYGEWGICGTRGWVNMEAGAPGTAGASETPEQAHSAKVNAREAMRLETSLQSAEAAGLRPIVFLHYPPVYGSSCNYDMLEVLWRHPVKDCWYGHIHGRSQHRYAINGERDGICYHLISGDYVQFIPQKIL